MEKYQIISSVALGSFKHKLDEIYMKLGDILDLENLEGRHLQYAKIFLSDVQNQRDDFFNSLLYNEILVGKMFTIVEQPPLNRSKISILYITSDIQLPFTLQSIRLSPEDVHCKDSYAQTKILIQKYIDYLDSSHLSLADNCMRTWFYIMDIDNNYSEVVKATKEVFQANGLSIDTHFIANTCIGSNSLNNGVLVSMDFLTYPKIQNYDVKYLKSLNPLNNVDDYCAAFESGVCIADADSKTVYISGMTCIDEYGKSVYVGDVMRQAGRLLENIGYLLKNGGVTMNNVQYFVIYLRDISDYDIVEKFMQTLYPKIPHIILEERAYHPSCLIEMECVAKQY